MVAIEGENMRGVTWVTVEDGKSGDWGIGGKPLTTEAVKALASRPQRGVSRGGSMRASTRAEPGAAGG